MTSAEVEVLDRNARSARSSNSAALMHSIEYLRTTPGEKWVVNKMQDCYLHGTWQLPGGGQYFHFYHQGRDFRMEVFSGMYQRTTPVNIVGETELPPPFIQAEMREALVSYYGSDEMFAVNPTFQCAIDT
jgi:hypothetical protein